MDFVKLLTREEAEKAGFSSYNPGRHLCVDISDEDAKDSFTISCKIKGHKVTVSFETEGNDRYFVDLKHHNGQIDPNDNQTFQHQNVIVWEHGQPLFLPNNKDSVRPNLTTVLLYPPSFD